MKKSIKKVVHISDTHFGKVDPIMINAIIAWCKNTRPDVVIISGDLTQRARLVEFEAARDFIFALRKSCKNIVAIPGNHDIAPLYTPVNRILHAYERYNKIIVPITVQEYADDQLAILGINTVRSSRLKDGRISKKDISRATLWFNAQSEMSTRIVVTHHPIDLPHPRSATKLVLGSNRAVYALAEAGVDMYLSGHHHTYSVAHTSVRYSKPHNSAIAIQAGTVSTRTRHETQSFNLMCIEQGKVVITIYNWNLDKKDFTIKQSQTFVQHANQWESL